MSKREIKQAMNEVFNEHFTRPQGVHNADHDWIQLKREQEHRRIERWEKWKTSAGGAIIVGIFAGIAAVLTWIWNNAAHLWALTNGGNHGTH